MQDPPFELRPGNQGYFRKTFDFADSMRRAFAYQSTRSEIYRQFLDAFGWDFDKEPNSVLEIPFLPIETFKHHAIQSGSWECEKVFRSSGTTGAIRSQHQVRRVADYHQHSISLFENQFGPLKDFVVLALLPNYLEAGDSSLVSMVTAFMERSGQSEEGFFMHDFGALSARLRLVEDAGKRVLLFGVTFAMLDFAEEIHAKLAADTILIETGGMKGRGAELSRTELHLYFKKQFGLTSIYSEYGMTELMSQAYTQEEGLFLAPPCMQIFIKEINDPFAEVAPGKTGVIHVVDLANIDTCSFIGTSDLGRKHTDGTFEVLGRLDNSDLRGCHLLYL